MLPFLKYVSVKKDNERLKITIISNNNAKKQIKFTIDPIDLPINGKKIVNAIFGIIRQPTIMSKQFW